MITRSATLLAALFLTASGAFAQDAGHVDAPRNEAEAALVAAVDNPALQRAFEGGFTDATVFVRIEPDTYAALQQAKAEGRTSFEHVPMKFWAVEPVPGVKAVAAYLSEQGFNNHHRGHHWISLTGRNLLTFATSNGFGVWITDAGPDGGESDGHTVLWTPEEVSLVLGRNPPRTPAAP